MIACRSRSAGPLLVLFLTALSCGGNRHLESVTLQPSVATAQNGQFQFTATGKFSAPPSPVTLTSKNVTWCYGGIASSMNPVGGQCAGNIAQFASVDQNGMAQCETSFHGDVLILAGVPSGPAMPDTGDQLKVYGAATLTCP